MTYRVRWDPSHTVGTVQNEGEGMPFLGVVRKQDLLDGWTATSAVYAAAKDLGVFADEHEAVLAVVHEARILFDRRATNSSIAKVPVGSIPRVTGTGRTEVTAPSNKVWIDYAERHAKAKRTVPLEVDLVVTEDGEHVCEATP